ncbi:MAG: hypothetical protein HeimC3_35420 [Candidatus Heimdallarchaeota archaeon LC_3]|nr:MAG: hypothetical protein HeimC3_35420 [Candidatus Heimdallarchaeota archaeon LC_3]
MEEYYNEYTYEINSDLTINLLNRCYKLDDILDPEITINEHSNSISFDFGWHIFELNLQNSTFLTIAVRENAIGFHAFIDDDEFPFSITDKDEVFIGLFNVDVETLAIIPVKKQEKIFVLNKGKICLSLANNNLEYFASPVIEVLNEYYRIRILYNNNTNKGGLLIQKGAEGFFDNILSPMLNQIDLNNHKHSELLMIQNNYSFNKRNPDKNDSNAHNYNIEIDYEFNKTNIIATNIINDVLEFFNKNQELKEDSYIKDKHWFNLFLNKTLFLGKSFFILLVSFSMLNLLISLLY